MKLGKLAYHESLTFNSLKYCCVKKTTRYLFSKWKAKRSVKDKEILFWNMEESPPLKIRRECIVMVWSKQNLICFLSWLKVQTLVLEGMPEIFQFSHYHYSHSELKINIEINIRLLLWNSSNKFDSIFRHSLPFRKRPHRVPVCGWDCYFMYLFLKNQLRIFAEPII